MLIWINSFIFISSSYTDIYPVSSGFGLLERPLFSSTPEDNEEI